MNRFIPHSHVIQVDGHLEVKTVWSATDGTKLDRLDGIGYTLPVKHLALANRLADAINAGAVFIAPSLAVDRNGKRYVEAHVRVLGRTMNADLRRLGY